MFNAPPQAGQKSINGY